MEAESHVREMRGRAGFQLNASATASGSSGQVYLPPPGPNESFATVAGTLTAPIPNVGRVGAQTSQAVAMLEAARQEFRRTTLDVAFRSSQAYYALWRARDGMDIAALDLKEAGRQLADIQTRIKAGDVPPADLIKAQVPVAQDKAALVRAQNALTIAQETLSALLGRDNPDEIALARPDLSGISTLSPERASALAAQKSPDVLEAEAGVSQYAAAVRLARHGRDLDWSLQLTHERSNDPTAYAYLTTLGVTITLPVLDGGTVTEQVRQAEAELVQSQRALEAARKNARLAAEEAALEVAGDQSSLEATSEATTIAQESLDKARQSYAAGLTTTRDVLDALFQLAQTRNDENSARYDLGIARARLRQALGGGTP